MAKSNPNYGYHSLCVHLTLISSDSLSSIMHAPLVWLRFIQGPFFIVHYGCFIGLISIHFKGLHVYILLNDIRWFKSMSMASQLPSNTIHSCLFIWSFLVHGLFMVCPLVHTSLIAHWFMLRPR